MRRTKITTFIALTAVSAFFLFLSSTPLARGRSLKTAPSESGSITATFVGIGGMVFQPGQYLGVKWVLEGDGVKYLENNPWSECELFFSADGGRTWSTMSPHLGVSRRNFDWTVPNVPTQQGIIALQIGIEGEGEFHVFPSAPFTVLPGRR